MLSFLRALVSGGRTFYHSGDVWTSGPLLCQFHVASITQSEFSSLTTLKAWGDMGKFCSDIALLLVSTKEEATGDRMYGLSTVWVNPCWARVPTVEEVVRELTASASSGPNWPYALVWLNGDTHHAPLPREGHLGILPQGGTNSIACGRISQLKVCQLLSSGLQVIYPVGLNGWKIPLITPQVFGQWHKPNRRQIHLT